MIYYWLCQAHFILLRANANTNANFTPDKINYSVKKA